jgi:hypothetical protein
VAGYFASQLLVARMTPASPGLLSWIPMPVRFVGYAVILYLTLFRGAEAQGFIYTQF